jgi:hypothetical protein
VPGGQGPRPRPPAARPARRSAAIVAAPICHAVTLAHAPGVHRAGNIRAVVRFRAAAGHGPPARRGTVLTKDAVQAPAGSPSHDKGDPVSDSGPRHGRGPRSRWEDARRDLPRDDPRAERAVRRQPRRDLRPPKDRAAGLPGHGRLAGAAVLGRGRRVGRTHPGPPAQAGQSPAQGSLGLRGPAGGRAPAAAAAAWRGAAMPPSACRSATAGSAITVPASGNPAAGGDR